VYVKTVPLPETGRATSAPPQTGHSPAGG
jgi:hypothetical protein